MCLGFREGPNCSHQREKIVEPQNPLGALRGGVRHMVLPLLRVCGTVQQNPHMRALVSGSDSTVEQKEKYRPQVLAKCVCTPGTERLALGMLLERFGLVNVHCGVMSFEAFWGGDRHYGSVELRADLSLHRLRWRHVRDQSVLVLADVCPERCRHSHRHCSRLGQSWRWRDPDLYDVGTFQSYGGFRNGAEYLLGMSRWWCQR